MYVYLYNIFIIFYFSCSSPFRFVLNSNAADLFHLLTSEHHWIPLEPRQGQSVSTDGIIHM